MNFKLNLLPHSAKIAISFFIFILISGVLVSSILLNFSFRTEIKFKPVGLEEIKSKYSYPPLKRAVLTSMKDYLETDDELNAIVNWCDAGGERYGYEQIEPIINRRCIRCHGNGITRADVSLMNWGDLSSLGITKGFAYKKLLLQTHYHIFGIGFIILLLALLLSISQYSRKLKNSLIIISFSSLIIDISSWWFSRFFENAAILILVFGSLMILSIVIISLLCLYDMWYRKSMNNEQSSMIK